MGTVLVTLNSSLLSPLSKLADLRVLITSPTIRRLVARQVGSIAAEYSQLARAAAAPMHLDFEIQRSTRRCAATDRALVPGEAFFSVLEGRGADVVRSDFSPEAWQGPPEGAIGWWMARVPEASAKKVKLAPNDVLLQLFDQLGDQAENEDMRYVLALLLIRRRVLRVETPVELLGSPLQPDRNGETGEMITLYCPKRDTSYCVSVVMPEGKRVDEIQQRLSEWLIAEAA
jgi:hypothetical protein